MTKFRKIKIYLPFLAVLLTWHIGYAGFPDNSISEQYEFDKEGRLVEKTSPDGNKIKYKYNNKGFLVEIRYPDDTVKYDYDANGNRIWMQNKAGRTEYKYDVFGRLIEVVSKYSPVKKIRYGYNPWDMISSIEIFEGNRLDYKVEYEYDIFGNLKSINDSTGITRYNYHSEKGEVVRDLPNGIKTIFSYSSAGKLNSLRHLNKDNSLIASYSYEYNSAGKISKILEKTTEGSKITKYEWDNRGYLNALHLPDNSRIQYEYDVMGNLISMKDSKGLTTYQYDGYGRHIKVGNVKYEWDTNGNLTGRIERDSRSRIIYDSRGLPLLVKTPDATEKYSWDGDGNMISRSIGNNTTYFLPDPLAPPGITLAEYDRTGKLSASYLHGDGLIGQRDIKGHTNYFLRDGFGSAHNMADIKGKIMPIQRSTSNYAGLPLSYKLWDRSNRHIARAWELIEKGQRLPMPSQSEINARESYWTEGRYWEEDPYYKFIKSLDSAQDITDIDTYLKVYATTHLLIANDMIVRPFAAVMLGWRPFFVKQAGSIGHDILMNYIEAIAPDGEGKVITDNLRKYDKKFKKFEDAVWWLKIFGNLGKAALNNSHIEYSLSRSIYYSRETCLECYIIVTPFGFDRLLSVNTIEKIVIGPIKYTNRLRLNLSTFLPEVRNIIIKEAFKKGISKGRDALSRHFINNENDGKNSKNAEKSKHEMKELLHNNDNELNKAVDLDKQMIPERDLSLSVDLARLSEAAYKSDRMKPFGDDTQGYWIWKKAGYMKSGLNWTLFERKKPNGKIERVLTFAGTEIRDRTRGGIIDLRDWLTNFHQEVYLGSHEKSLPAQYADALKVASSFISEADSDKNMSLLFTGHSLGGAIAQFLSLHSGIRAFVYNSAPLGIGTQTTNDRTLFKEVTQARRKLAATNIVNIHLRGDPVHEIPGTQLGRQYMIDPAPGIHGISSDYIEGFTADAVKRHGLDVLIPSLRHYQDNLHYGGTPSLKPAKDSNNSKLSKQNKSNKDDDKAKKVKEDKDDEKKYPPGCPWCGGSMGGGGNGGNAGGPPRCPPFCCPPSCGDGGMGGMGGPDNHFKPVESKLGGIKLNATAQFAANLGNITGAVYDPEKQVMVLVGDDKDLSLSSIKPEDLAVALMSVFGPIPQDPQFSLDPDNPMNPRGKWLKAVYIPEQIIGGTEFGKALYEADWLLKQYSFGVRIDEDKKIQERKSSVLGFKSTADLFFEEKNHRYGGEQWARLWITLMDLDKDKKYNVLLKLGKDGNTIYFDAVKMQVKAKKQVPDRSSTTGLKDVDTEDDPVATRFVKKFTELYDEIAKESPEFERVRELAKVVAIAKWIKKKKILFDVDWVNEYANKRIDKPVGRVTALSTEWKKKEQFPFKSGNQTGIQTITQNLYLFGGVDLTVKPKFVKDDGTAQNIQKGVLAKLKEGIEEPVFYINDKGKSLKAVVLPITPNGKKLWKSPSSPSPSIITVDGIQYKTNNQGKIVKSIDSEGNATEYSWDANQRLSEFKISFNNGWSFSESKKGGYLEITTINPLKDKFLYKYTPSGNLSEIAINGQKYASMNYKEGEVTVDYADFSERVRYDSSGRIKRYEVHSRRDGLSKAKSEAIDISYDKDGNLTEINNPVTGHIRLAYVNGNIKTLSTTQGKADYAYDLSTGNIKQINTTWGESAKYSYNGDNLTGITYINGDYHREVIFENGLPVKIKDANSEFRYKFAANGLLEQVVDPTGASESYLYDEQNKIKKITLLDGSSTNIQYEGHYSKDAEDVAIKKIKVVRIPSKRSSSPITKKESAITEDVKNVPAALARRLEDIKEADKNLKNGVILDIFVEGKDVAHGNIASGGEIRRIDNETTKELRRLLNITAKTQGNPGNKVLKGWEKIYNANLAQHVKPVSWTTPDGKKVKLKPFLIIKSNEVNYKYANLERVPVLVDNLIIFIASKTEEAKDAPETSAKEIVSKINDIPKLTKRNAAFIIRLPKMNKVEQVKWDREINNLQKLVGKDNVLVDPSKDELKSMLQNKGKDIIAIELTHTDNGILLKNGGRYTSKDINQGGDLSHIKYLVSGNGTCNLPRLEEGKFTASLKKKGVGIINASYREVSSEIALKKLKELINIISNIKEYDLYPYHLFDIINQMLGAPGDGTTNLGKKESQEDYLFG